MSDDKKKSVAESEREAGLIFFNDDSDFLKQRLTREEWDELVAKDPLAHLGMNWDDREAWLQTNGYEVTRENLRDSTLTTKAV